MFSWGIRSIRRKVLIGNIWIRMTGSNPFAWHPQRWFNYLLHDLTAAFCFVSRFPCSFRLKNFSNFSSTLETVQLIVNTEELVTYLLYKINISNPIQSYMFCRLDLQIHHLSELRKSVWINASSFLILQQKLQKDNNNSLVVHCKQKSTFIKNSLLQRKLNISVCWKKTCTNLTAVNTNVTL